MLIDTGCTNSLISLTFLEHFQNKYSVQLNLEPQTAHEVINTAGPNPLHITGLLEVTLYMTDEHSRTPRTVELSAKVYVVQNLTIPLILGAEVLFAQSCHSLTASFLSFFAFVSSGSSPFCSEPVTGRGSASLPSLPMPWLI